MTGDWTGRHVFLTGHTGFKGAWMALLLTRLGARVTGYALPPETEGTVFAHCDVAARLHDQQIADIRDADRLARAVRAARPDVIFHLAAQSLVLRSYDQPIETFATNVMGTAHLLEAARQLDRPCAVVVVTTDKVYDNPETVHPLRESDRLGAADPYATSKAAAELVAATWRKSFAGLRIATVRAGNVIGGGDRAENRLVPDCARAFAAGMPAQIRNPDAVRPWQHALDPLTGYLAVADRLVDDDRPAPADPAWNFGPDLQDEASAQHVATRAAQVWGGGARVEIAPVPGAPKEAGLLRLDSAKARLELGWRPVWGLDAALEATMAWYRACADGQDMAAVTDAQIAAFLADAGAR